MKWKCFALLVTFNVIQVVGQEEPCKAASRDIEQMKHYATRTPYEAARKSDESNFSLPSKNI